MKAMTHPSAMMMAMMLAPTNCRRRNKNSAIAANALPWSRRYAIRSARLLLLLLLQQRVMAVTRGCSRSRIGLSDKCCWCDRLKIGIATKNRKSKSDALASMVISSSSSSNRSIDSYVLGWLLFAMTDDQLFSKTNSNSLHFLLQFCLIVQV